MKNKKDITQKPLEKEIVNSSDYSSVKFSDVEGVVRTKFKIIGFIASKRSRKEK